MMEEEFYSTLKLTSGEEIIAKVCYLPEEDSLLVEHPMLVEKLTQKKNGNTVQGFVLKEWINSTYETLFVIRMEQVVTMSELDKKIEVFYLNNLNDTEEQSSNEIEDSINIKPNKFSKQMGYLGSVKENKRFLEDIYKKS
jgi:hypothetical protein